MKIKTQTQAEKKAEHAARVAKHASVDACSCIDRHATTHNDVDDYGSVLGKEAPRDYTEWHFDVGVFGRSRVDGPAYYLFEKTTGKQIRRVKFGKAELSDSYSLQRGGSAEHTVYIDGEDVGNLVVETKATSRCNMSDDYRVCGYTADIRYLGANLQVTCMTRSWYANQSVKRERAVDARTTIKQFIAVLVQRIESVATYETHPLPREVDRLDGADLVAAVVANKEKFSAFIHEVVVEAAAKMRESLEANRKIRDWAHSERRQDSYTNEHFTLNRCNQNERASKVQL